MDLTATQKKGYYFPILKNDDIVQCMAELGIALTTEELNEPHRHRDRVKAVFLLLVEMGLGLTKTDLSTPSEAVLEKKKSLPYPELHQESLSELRFLKASMKFMGICGFHDFGWKDLHAPTSQRFRRQLSGAINYARFREERMKIFDELTTQREEIVEQLQEVQDEGAKLSFQLEEAKLATEKELKEMEEVENDCVEIETEIAQQNKLQATFRQESTNLKKKANELKDKIATVALTLREAEAEERKLSSQIVQSPERIKGEMAEVAKTLERERSECANAEDEARVARKKIHNVVQAKEDVDRAIVLMAEVAEEKSKYESVMKEKHSAITVITNNQRKTSEVVEKQENYESCIHRTEENIAHLRKEGKLKMDAAKDALMAAEEELLLVEKDRMEGMAKIERGEAEVRAIEHEMEEERLKANAEIAEMIDHFRQLEAVVLEKDDELLSAIGA